MCQINVKETFRVINSAKRKILTYFVPHSNYHPFQLILSLLTHSFCFEETGSTMNIGLMSMSFTPAKLCPLQVLVHSNTSQNKNTSK